MRNAVAQGLIEEARGREEIWVADRLRRHRAPGEPHIQHRADGRWIQVNERKTAEGGTVAVYTNITEIKRAEEEIREAKHWTEQANERVSEQNRALEATSAKLSKSFPAAFANSNKRASRSSTPWYSTVSLPGSMCTPEGKSATVQSAAAGPTGPGRPCAPAHGQTRAWSD